MADSLNDVKDIGSNFARTLASRQLPAVHEYAEALQSYVDGKTDEIELGKRLFNLGVREVSRTAQDYLKFGFQMWSKALSVTGVKVGEAMSGSDTSTGAQPGAKSAKR